MSRLISHEEIDSVRQCNEITEKGSKIEEKGRDKKNGKRRCDSSGLQEGRKGSQELIEKNRDGEKKACIESQLEEGKKGFRNAKGHEVHSQVSFVDVTE